MASFIQPIQTYGGVGDDEELEPLGFHRIGGQDSLKGKSLWFSIGIRISLVRDGEISSNNEGRSQTV